ncbi:hypothetical protein O7632_15080 [Solwaraspora sp. WMMD406]|uniref:hypothetical protein n=1 Tax=Solwaraspora sp. WMMD406 TaxID=3016095 RepID=UPI002415A77A|nr:hypothetical protein [Solwaraspora sp. WMMD406]MDG4765408.1 hypothetical protein [Solwaraspora sp. WMMD406]
MTATDDTAHGGTTAAADTGSPDGEALRVAADTVASLRTACLALEAAVTYAGEHLAGARHPDARTVLDRYADALTEAWEAYGDVHDAVTDARPHLPGAAPVGVAAILHGLRTARHQAQHAAVTILESRHRIGVAADRLRHSDDPRAQAAGNRLRAALAHTDQLGAGLAIGTRAIDRYLDALDTGQDPPQRRRQRLARQHPITTAGPDRQPPPEVRRIGTRAAAALVAAHRDRIHFRTSWQQLRQGFWDNTKRTWRLW